MMKRFCMIAVAVLMGVSLAACTAEPTAEPVTPPTETVTTTSTEAMTTAATVPTEPVATASAITVRRADAEDGIATHEVSTSEYAIRLVLEADGYAPCVNVMRLGFDSEANYQIEEVFSLGAIDADAPLAVTVDFPGDMSAWGLSFTDGDGNERTFTLFQSGLDGSINMSEGIG